MSRTSRIPHPPGSRFVSLYHWAVRRFGIGGAAVLGLLDFLDRAHDVPEQPLASRARIIADLEGIIGRNGVDRALQDLVAAGVIRRNEETSMGRRNWETRVEYSLNIAGLRQLLASTENGSYGESRDREFPGVPESGTDLGLIRGVAYKNLEVKEDVYKEAAPRAPARGPAAAADPAIEQKRKHPRRTANKIECWYPSEDGPADGIEVHFPPEQIAAAVAVVRARPNSRGNRTSPVPALVAEELERVRREKENAEHRAVVRATREVEERSLPPPEVQRQRIAAIAAALRTGQLAQGDGLVCSR
jgi:hypothetical protein